MKTLLKIGILTAFAALFTSGCSVVGGALGSVTGTLESVGALVDGKYTNCHIIGTYGGSIDLPPKNRFDYLNTIVCSGEHCAYKNEMERKIKDFEIISSATGKQGKASDFVLKDREFTDSYGGINDIDVRKKLSCADREKIYGEVYEQFNQKRGGSLKDSESDLWGLAFGYGLAETLESSKDTILDLASKMVKKNPYTPEQKADIEKRANKLWGEEKELEKLYAEALKAALSK